MSMTISIDDDLKHDFSSVCKEIGLNPSAAFNVFAKAVVRERRIPFELSADSAETRARHAYEASVADGLWESYRQFDRGEDCSRSEFESIRAALRGTA